MKKHQLLLLLAIAGCAPAPKYSDKGKPIIPFKKITEKSVVITPSLKGKSVLEIIDLKYKGEIYLNCDLYVEEGTHERWKMAGKPVDSFTVRQNQFFSNTVLMLQHRMFGQEFKFEVGLAKDLAFFETYNYPLENKEYIMQNAPVMTVKYEKTASYDEAAAGGEWVLPEKVEDSLHLKTIAIDENQNYTEEVRCTLKTFAVAPYLDQWSVKELTQK